MSDYILLILSLLFSWGIVRYLVGAIIGACISAATLVIGIITSDGELFVGSVGSLAVLGISSFISYYILSFLFEYALNKWYLITPLLK